jgi:probable addiction module antidote protein
MSKQIKIADLVQFDAAAYLTSETAIAAYLTDILEEGDAGLLASALGDIARARGMAEIAKKAGITREALYKALRPDSAPRFDTVSRVCTALGVSLVAKASNRENQVMVAKTSDPGMIVGRASDRGIMITKASNRATIETVKMTGRKAAAKVRITGRASLAHAAKKAKA